MARKEKNIHYIYKTTCNVTGKYYVGMHSTSNLEDGYMGSGTRLRRSIRKYGVANHTKEILELLPTRETLVLREIDIVTNELIAEPMCMNLVTGGQGGFISLEGAKKGGISANKILNERREQDPSFKEYCFNRRSEAVKKAYLDGNRIAFGGINFSGKTHTDETKQLMSEQRKGSGTGETNSQYGTCWITKDGINKKIKKEEFETYLLGGWIKGRK